MTNAIDSTGPNSQSIRKIIAKTLDKMLTIVITVYKAKMTLYEVRTIIKKTLARPIIIPYMAF